jgi:hypothetical protein
LFSVVSRFSLGFHYQYGPRNLASGTEKRKTEKIRVWLRSFREALLVDFPNDEAAKDQRKAEFRKSETKRARK